MGSAAKFVAPIALGYGLGEFLGPSLFAGGAADSAAASFGTELAGTGAGAGAGAAGAAGLESLPAASWGSGVPSAGIPGLAGGAENALGLPNMTFPGESTVPAAATGGTAGSSGLGVPAGAPTGGAGVPSAGTTGGSASIPGASQAGGSVVDSILKQMKQNAVPLAMMGASTLAGAKKPAQLPGEQQMLGLGQQAGQAGSQLLQQFQAGNLSPGQQAQIDDMARNTKNQLAQYFASIGQSDSTAARQAFAQVDQQALMMKQQMLDQTLQQGLSAVGAATGPLNTVAQYQLGQDRALREAFGSFAQGVGTLFGRGSAQGAPATAAPAVS